MKFKALSLISIAFFFFFPATAQQVTFGLKIGHNFSKITGELEVNRNDEIFETMRMKSSFHVGVSASRVLSNGFGLRTGLLYTQKGGEQHFDGLSKWTLYSQEESEAYIFTGKRNSILRINNSYIAIPITGYGTFGNVEFSAGLYLARLISSKGRGKLSFQGFSAPLLFQTIPGGLAVDIESTLEYDYLNDEEADRESWKENDEFNIISWSDGVILYPKVAHAYDEYSAKNHDFYKHWDFGLTFSLAYFFSDKFFTSMSLDYGLSDITTNRAYSRLYALHAGGKTHKDTNITFQISVGHHF